MRLFSNRVAPNPVKVELYLAEKSAAGCEIPVERVFVNLPKGEHRTPEFAKRNPFRRAPVLELDDGSHIPESLAIIEYFEELHPRPSLIGDTPAQRGRVRALERAIDLDVLGSIGQIVHATNSPIGLPPSPDIAQRSQQRLEHILAILDEQLADGRPFVAGDKPTIADCTLGAALQFARFGGTTIPERFSRILEWDRTYRVRDAVKAVIIR